jgi:hypothetical protein
VVFGLNFLKFNPKLYIYQVGFNMKIFEKKNSIPAEDENQVFNKYAFADHRVSVPKELDNDLEKFVYDDLVKFDFGGHNLSKKSTDIIKYCLKNNLYRDMFRKPKVNEIYRGMSLTFNKFKKLYKHEINETDFEEINGKFTFKPLPGINATSWTLDEDVAADYATGTVDNIDSKAVYFIMYARVSDNDINNLLQFKHGFYTTHQLNREKFNFYEANINDEVLAFGPIKIHKLRYKVRD